MTGSPQQAVLDTLEWLEDISSEGIRPEAARGRFQRLRQRHAEMEIELLWEEEALDGSVHYDALLHLPKGGTISMSVCPDRVLPWPLRGVHRWSDADLVRINQIPLKVDQAIACLDFLWDETRLVDRLVNVCLIQEALEKEPIELSDAEVQEAMDAFRRERRLFTAADAHAWMERHGTSHERLERLVAGQAQVARLRDRVTAGKVEPYFEARPADFDTAAIARFDVPDEESAQHLSEQIRGSEVDFLAAAQQRFLEKAGRPGVSSRPLFETLQRRQAPPELADAVFAATTGEFVGPVRAGEAYALIRVLSITPASLEGATRRAMQEILFDEWLAERRQAAMIEWCWGNAQQTSRMVG